MPKQNDISELLIKLLLIYEEIEIVGVGLFTLHRIKQFIGTQESLIIPPINRIYYHPSKKSKNEFFSCVLNEGLLTAKQEIKIRKKIEKSFNKFLNFGVFDMGEFGKVKRLENGNVLFEAGNATDFRKDTFYLPSVLLKPIHDEKIVISEAQSLQDISSDQPPQEIVRQTKISEQKGIFQKYFPFLAMALVAIVLAYLIYIMLGKKADTSIDNKSLSNEKNNIESLYQGDSQRTIDEREELIFNQNLQKYKGIITPEIMESGCVIVAGTFNDRTNAERFYSRLEIKGYNGYIQDYKGMTRVGVKYDCSKYDLVDYLIQFRADISNKAWYLIPDFNPIID